MTTASSLDARSPYVRFSVVVLLALLCFVGSVEVVLRASVIREDIDAHLVERVYRSQRTSAMFGDSHFRNAFRVETPEFINLSSNGSNTRMMRISVNEYFRHRVPDKVIVQASAQLFSKPRLVDNVHGMDDFFGQNKVKLPFQIFFFEPGVARLLSRRKRYFDIADIARLSQPGEPATPDDPLVANDSWTNRAEAFRRRKLIERIDFHRPLADFERSPDFTAYRELLTTLHTRGATVCMLRTPVTQGYLDAIANDSQYSAAESAMRRLASEIGVRYVDFRDLPMAFPDSVFRDQDHLNRTGARQFVPRVLDRCFPPKVAD